MGRLLRRGGLRLGRVAGIEVYAHPTFILFLLVIAALPLARGEGMKAALEALGLLLAVFACVVLHELGHALTARRFGIHTRDIILLPIGGVASLERMPERPLEELLVALAGPAVNWVLVALGLGLFYVSDLPGEALFNLDNAPFLVEILWINLSLGLFNLIPAFPMDGGRVLRALLAVWLGTLKATRVAVWVGQGLAVGLGILGYFYNPMLILLAAFIIYGARGERRGQELQAALAGIALRQVMQTRFRVLEASDLLSRAVSELLSGYQQAFPVLFGERAVGLLSRRELVRALAAGQQEGSLWTIMRRDVPMLEPDANLFQALTILEKGQSEALLVMDDGILVGLLTVQDIHQAVMLHEAGLSWESMKGLRAGAAP